MRKYLLFTLLLAASVAKADRGALSVDVAAGGIAAPVPALLADSPHSTLSMDASFWLGGRYALSNSLELSLTGFFEPPATVFQNDVTLVVESGRYPGTTRHQFLRFGAQAGLHAVFGMRFRFHLGLEVGWAQLVYSGLVHYDVTDSNAAVDYGLQLPDVSRAHLVLAPLLGVEWAAGDKWSLAVLPRAQLLLGDAFSWAVVVPLQFSWSWYL
jgi:hypothetical protein